MKPFAPLKIFTRFANGAESTRITYVSDQLTIRDVCNLPEINMDCNQDDFSVVATLDGDVLTQEKFDTSFRNLGISETICIYDRGVHPMHFLILIQSSIEAGLGCE